MKMIVGFLSAILRSLLDLSSENCQRNLNCFRSLSFGFWSESVITTPKLLLKSLCQF